MEALGQVWPGSKVANVGTASLGGCHRSEGRFVVLLDGEIVQIPTYVQRSFIS
jgi:hypothetical protein